MDHKIIEAYYQDLAVSPAYEALKKNFRNPEKCQEHRLIITREIYSKCDEVLTTILTEVTGRGLYDPATLDTNRDYEVLSEDQHREVHTQWHSASTVMKTCRQKYLRFWNP